MRAGAEHRDPLAAHPFVTRPHGTLLSLSVPVLVSLIAEPLTGLVDTAFVKELGSAPAAALGVSTTLLSSVLWVFSFLGVSTQTEVAGALGSGRRTRAGLYCGVAALLALLVGTVVALAALPCLAPIARLMGAGPDVEIAAVTYLRVRLFGAPAVLVMTACFGGLRGAQDMRSPMYVSIAVNVLNVVLDAALIFGWGVIPALGLSGAAWASTAAQWAGAVWAFLRLRRAVPLAYAFDLGVVRALLVVGRDMFLRTGAIALFLALTTRAATRLGPEAGAVHQAVRQVWILLALALDAYAATAQTLVAFFFGAGQREHARRAGAVALLWSFGTGVFLALGMLLGTGLAASLLVPPGARPLFAAPWLVAAVFQPVNAVSFATDGMHWGAGDYRFLRNASLAATTAGVGMLAIAESFPHFDLRALWMVTGGWICVRSLLGFLRVWPGIGRAPLARGPDGREP